MKSGTGGCVACNDDSFAALIDEKLGYAMGEAPDLLNRPRPIRDMYLIRNILSVFFGKQAANLAPY
jgi:hypothetical protein